MNTNNQKGFTLIELLVVMVIIGIIASIYTPSLEVEVKEIRIDSVINELDIIANGAQNYAMLNQSSIDASPSLTNAFPNQINQCSNAIDVMLDSHFLVGISVSSTWFDEPFTTSCSSQTFSVGLKTDNNYAYRIKNSIGSVEVVNDVATYTVPKPSLLPIIDDYIALLDGSTNTWNAQSKTIANVADVSYTFGSKASQAVYNIGLVCDSIIPSDCPFATNDPPNQIDKPNCPDGATPIFIIGGVSVWGNSVNIDKTSYLVTQGDGFWKLNFSIGSKDTINTGTYWSYMTKCK